MPKFDEYGLQTLEGDIVAHRKARSHDAKKESTHYAGCWTSHEFCALGLVEDLVAEVRTERQRSAPVVIDGANCDQYATVDFGDGTVQLRCTQTGEHEQHRCDVWWPA